MDVPTTSFFSGDAIAGVQDPAVSKKIYLIYLINLDLMSVVVLLRTCAEYSASSSKIKSKTKQKGKML